MLFRLKSTQQKTNEKHCKEIKYLKDEKHLLNSFKSTKAIIM